MVPFAGVSVAAHREGGKYYLGDRINYAAAVSALQQYYGDISKYNLPQTMIVIDQQLASMG